MWTASTVPDRLYSAEGMSFFPLESETVLNGWMSKEDFLTGYGATQAVPGPLFTFAAYLGVLIQGIPGGIVATLAIFCPDFCSL